METKEIIARFRISESELDISGSAEFVKEQVHSNMTIISLFAESIKHKIAQRANQLSKAQAGNMALAPLTVASEEQAESDIKGQEEYAEFEEVKDTEDLLTKYNTVLAENGNKLQILSNIPGNSQSARMINIVLIYLYWKLKRASVDKVSYAELRAVCEMHGDLDAGHFASSIKKHKKWFLVDGSSKSLSAKITVPGMKEAERLLDIMNK